MKFVWVVYSERTLSNATHAFDMMCQAALRCGAVAQIRFVERIVGCVDDICYEGEPVILPDLVLMRCYHAECSAMFEKRGIRVINSTESMQLSLDKMRTYDVLIANGISSPLSVDLTTEDESYASICDKFESHRFVVKAKKGAKGEQVFLVDGDQSMTDSIAKCGEDCLAQRFVESSFGRDIRLWVIGDQVVGGVERYNDTSFVSNFSAGGRVRPVQITPEVEALAVRGSRALGLEFSGVDLLYDRDTFSICEINGNAGFRSLASLCETNIPELLFRYILR